jgi:hypothetical protein
MTDHILCFAYLAMKPAWCSRTMSKRSRSAGPTSPGPGQGVPGHQTRCLLVTYAIDDTRPSQPAEPDEPGTPHSLATVRKLT